MYIVAHNLAAMNTQRQFGINKKNRAKVTERLASGYRINRAADDAAGLAISEKMRSQIRGLSQASRNAQDGISLIQVADGAMAEVHAMLQRGMELSVQAANDVLTDSDRRCIQQEIEQLKEEIDGLSMRANFNEIRVLRGDMGTVSDYTEEVDINGSLPSWVTMSSTTQLEDIGFVTDPTEYTYLDANNVTQTLEHSNKHAAATVDFSAFDGSDAKIDELVDNGFHSTCCTCSRHYSVTFTKETTSSVEMSGGHYVYKVGIGDLTTASGKGTGEELVKRIYEVTGDGEMDGHYTRMVIDGTNTSTLVIYDQRPMETASEIGFPADATNIHSSDWYATEFGVKAKISADGTGYGVFGPGYATGKGGADEMQEADLIFQVGAKAGQTIEVKLPSISSDRLGVSYADVSTQAGSSQAISMFYDAINIVSEERSRMGAYQNRLEHTIDSLNNTGENLQASESRIRDADMAKEMLEYSNINILEQVGYAMMAQANQSSQSVVNLLS